MDEQQPATQRGWNISIDLRDVMGIAGALIVLGCAYALDWRAAAAVVGASLCALAIRLSH
jgi:hypothetical protein